MKNQKGPPKVTVEDRAVIQIASALLLEIKHRGRITVATLAKRSGIREARVRAILYPGSQGSRALSLEEIRQVGKFGLSLVPGDSEANGSGVIRQLCGELASKVYEKLDFGVMSPVEYAFRSNLNIDPARQAAFGRAYAGVYANIRLTQNGFLGIARMDVYARREGAVLCGFITRRLSQGTRHERVVRGYMYQADDGAIHALGSIEGTSFFRTTVLKPFAGSDAGAADLFGLRLSVSELDDGPFASRLYCRRLVGLSSEDELPGWEGIFKSHSFNKKSIELIGQRIENIEAITDLLMERRKVAKPWGVAFPEGV